MGSSRWNASLASLDRLNSKATKKNSSIGYPLLPINS
jgi:hypothetical protein